MMAAKSKNIEPDKPVRVRIVVDVPDVWAWGETPESLAHKMLPHFDIIEAEWVDTPAEPD